MSSFLDDSDPSDLPCCLSFPLRECGARERRLAAVAVTLDDATELGQRPGRLGEWAIVEVDQALRRVEVLLRRAAGNAPDLGEECGGACRVGTARVELCRLCPRDDRR